MNDRLKALNLDNISFRVEKQMNLFHDETVTILKPGEHVWLDDDDHSGEHGREYFFDVRGNHGYIPCDSYVDLEEQRYLYMTTEWIGPDEVCHSDGVRLGDALERLK